MERIRIKDLSHKDHPYEKCLNLGPGSLSDTELLAVILRTESREGNSLDLADSLSALGGPGDGLLGLLHHSLGDFTQIKGVGKVKGVQLLRIGELSKRTWKWKASEYTLYFGRPEGVSDYYMEDMRHLEQKGVRVVFLDTKQAMVCDQIMARKAVNASVMTPHEILIEDLRCRAVPMVLIHNHPSGDPTPGRADMLLTKRLKGAGDLVRVTLIDRVVIGDRRYLSLREENSM